MSETPPTGLAPEPKSRIVSGSLKDRIAKFNNPSATPLVPTHAFGTAGPTPSNTSPAQRGLVGNRIPTFDSRNAMPLGSRKVSENKGLIGNRFPPPSSARSASPSGSVDSSNASAKPSSRSTGTSRSSSPPTSPGGELPPSLLAATLPDMGGPGAMTPSSTMADAGDEHLSPPTTPVAAPELPPPGYDLVPGNLKLNNPTLQGLAHSFAPSISSSLASQYDSSRAVEDQDKMMADVSGISTPMGTPKAAARDLEGGSVRGEGSVADMDDLRGRLESMDVVQTPREERQDPNHDTDLDALKAGELSHHASDGADPNPVNAIVEGAFVQNVDEYNIPADEKKEQGGEAGTKIDEFENPEEIEPMVIPPGVPSDQKEVQVDEESDFKLNREEEIQAEKLARGETIDLGGAMTAQDVGIEPSDSQATILPDSPRPTQVVIEPAPIAQDDVPKAADATARSESVIPRPEENLEIESNAATNGSDIDSSSFPSAPTDDPDVTDPVPAGASNITPLDPSIAKSFPDVPDEEKPRVEVHVSSPLNTPSKKAPVSETSTPLADIPAHSKSISQPPAEDSIEATPRSSSESTRSLSLSADDAHATPGTSRLQKRLSNRKSPKSPLLDDEDPGDFVPGEEGWAVVHK